MVTKRVFTVDQELKEYFHNVVVPEFYKHHPEFKNIHLSERFILSWILHRWVES